MQSTPTSRPVNLGAIDAVVTNTVLAACPDVLAVYRFGSWGTPWQRADSDLDIALLLPWETDSKVDGLHQVALVGEIVYATGIDFVDLINLRKAPTDIQAAVIRSGTVIYSGQDDARVGFEVREMNMRHDLDIERAHLYQDIIERGSVLQP